MIGVILNPRAGYVAAHGVDRVRAMILEALPDACIHVLEPEDDIAARCRDYPSSPTFCYVQALRQEPHSRAVVARE